MEGTAFHPNSRKARQEIRKEKTKQKKKDRKMLKVKEQQPKGKRYSRVVLFMQ